LGDDQAAYSSAEQRTATNKEMVKGKKRTADSAASAPVAKLPKATGLQHTASDQSTGNQVEGSEDNEKSDLTANADLPVIIPAAVRIEEDATGISLIPCLIPVP